MTSDDHGQRHARAVGHVQQPGTERELLGRRCAHLAIELEYVAAHTTWSLPSAAAATAWRGSPSATGSSIKPPTTSAVPRQRAIKAGRVRPAMPVVAARR